MSRGDYVAGLAWFAGTTGCTAAATALLLRAHRPICAAPRAWSAAGVLPGALLAAAHAPPLALGVMTRGTVRATAALALPAAARAHPGEPHSASVGRWKTMLPRRRRAGSRAAERPGCSHSPRSAWR